MQLRTARSWGVPLSTIRDGHDPRDWSRVSDRLTAVALTELEASLCPDCGQPKERAYNPDMSGHYEVIDVECQGCQALHEHVAGDKDRTPAVKVVVIDTYDPAEYGPLHPIGPLMPSPGGQPAPAAPPDTRDDSRDQTLGGAP